MSASRGNRRWARSSIGPTHLGPWGYRSSDGMGLLEFLEWCEDLKMEPVLGVFAGYSLRARFHPCRQRPGAIYCGGIWTR